MRQTFWHPSLVTNAASNWVVLGVHMIIGFFLTPFIIHYLGRSDYGIWTLVASIVGYYGVLGLGVNSAITPYTARYIGQRDWQALEKFVSTALTLFTGVGLIALVASFTLAAPLAKFFDITPDRFTAFQHTMWLVGFAAAVGFPEKTLSSVIRGYENYVASNCVALAAAFLRVGLTVWLLPRGFGLLGAALAVALSDTFSLIATTLLCRIQARRIRVRLFFGSWPMLRLLLLYGSTTAVIVFSDLLRFQIDTTVIGKFVGLEAVAVYSIAAVLMRYFCQGIRSAFKVLKPRFGILYGSGQKEELQRMLLRSTTVGSIFAFGGAALLVILGRPLIHAWVGPKFTDAVLPLGILVTAMAFEMAQNAGINVLYALDKIRFMACLWMVEALANAAISLVLVGPLGIVGVALGTAIPCLIVKLCILPLLVTRMASLTLFSYYLRLGLPLLLASGVVLLASLVAGSV